MHIIIYNNQCFNVDNDSDAASLCKHGARELTAKEISAYGMEGFEQYISPKNTVVLDDGSVTFTPPDIETQRKKEMEKEAARIAEAQRVPDLEDATIDLAAYIAELEERIAVLEGK